MYSKYNHIWCKLSVFCTFRSKFLSLSGEDLILQKLEMIKLSWGEKKKQAAVLNWSAGATWAKIACFTLDVIICYL